MTEQDRTLIEGVDVEAIDGDHVILSVRSFTDPEKRYMVTADFSSGIVRCECPDAVYRSKLMDFTDETGFSCRHMRQASKYLRVLSSALRLFTDGGPGVDMVQCQHENNAVPSNDAGEVR